jgi:glycine dehydrogenase subunit 1
MPDSTTAGHGTASAAAHPYMPNSLADIKAEMLEGTSASSIDELFSQIPAEHRLARPLELPRQLRSEVELRRHMLDLLSANQSCERNLSFLGAGCWQHYVPAVCDEIVARAEFLTSILGTPSSDVGRNQALFEFTSQIGDLLDMDFVGLPVYTYGCASGHAIRMAARMTGRRQVLVARSTDPERLAVIRNYCEPPNMMGSIEMVLIDYEPQTGLLDLDSLRDAISERTAAVYFESPSYLGVLEARAHDVAAIAHGHGAETIIGVDPITLGVVSSPGELGADIAVGTIQTLGVHMNCGGGAGGFIASRDEERYARQYPTLMVSACPTVDPDRIGFGMTLMEQSSYGSREKGNDWTGTSVYLWAIASAVYMSLLGPDGFHEIGEVILARSHYAAAQLGKLPGVNVRFPEGFFKEMVVNFDGTGRSVESINAALRGHSIFGGRDLSSDFPELGESALYCVTELHTQTDIDQLVDALGQELAR